MLTKNKDISSFSLHLLAMGLMLCDHLWATVIPGNDWLTWLGRMAYPIFAFLIVEGYHHTRNLKKYQQRLLFWALIAELPFDLMYGASWIYPFQQNVLWTFLLGLWCIGSVEKIRAAKPLWLGLPLSLLVCGGFCLLATLLMVDYSGYGVLMLLVFHFFRGRKWYHSAGQFLGLYYVNFELMGGQRLLLGSWEVPIQAFALLALLPIWCYRGRQGYHSKATQIFNYAFYPAHMLILGLLSR